MCGRFSLSALPEEVRELFRMDAAPPITPRYNIAPTQRITAVRVNPESLQREWAMLRWGLVPFWAKGPDIGNRMINARAETIAEKPSFRKAFRSRRCLIPADGYYEWKKEEGVKQPYHFRLKEGGAFAFAGIWEQWRGAEEAPEEVPEEAPLETCAIITTESNERIRDIHHRMPVILAPGDFDLWLSADEKQADTLQFLFRPLDAERVVFHRVSGKVNRAGFEDAECVAPIT